jgi:dihydrofolate synthase/folylpolyglutamate synthase
MSHPSGGRPTSHPTPPMTLEQAEQAILARELFGMRFGLDRMRRMLTALDHPQRRFATIHVVGTNGKSSTTRMIAAILQAHGLRTGAYLSPHLISFRERIRIADQDLEADAFAGAIARALRAAELVDRLSGEEDRVTQFELLTAAAFDELARREVQVGVIEAGLGGRYDATNVIDSRVQVLTGVGLEHTRWLGPTVAAIAGEKLDVVRPGATLVLGHGIHPDAAALARRVARERGARLVVAGADPGVVLAAPGAYQRRNFALALAAAEAFLGELDAEAVARAAGSVQVPGRLQVVDREPLTVLDGAHNPDGVVALVEALGELRTGGGRLVVVVSVLDDKDVGPMLANLTAIADALVLTQSHNPRSLPPPTLQSLAQQLGARHTEVVRRPHEALARARELAGRDGLALATGSIYLVADLLCDPATLAARRVSRM